MSKQVSNLIEGLQEYFEQTPQDELNRDKTSPIELIDQKTNSMISKIIKNN